MGMAARAAIAERLIAAGRSPDTPVAVVRWGTTDRQEVARTTLDRLAEVDLDAPAAIVVGAVAGLDLTAVPVRGGWLSRCTAPVDDPGTPARRRTGPGRPAAGRARRHPSWSPGPGPRPPSWCGASPTSGPRWSSSR